MAAIFTFLLGIGNFALHRAVVESGHRMIGEMEPAQLQAIRWLSLSFEFLLLCGVLFAVRSGHTIWLWAYMGYSVINGAAAWLIVSRRI